MLKVNMKAFNEELFYTQVMTKSKLKVSRFLKTLFKNLGNA